MQLRFSPHPVLLPSLPSLSLPFPSLPQRSILRSQRRAPKTIDGGDERGVQTKKEEDLISGGFFEDPLLPKVRLDNLWGVLSL